MRTLKLKVQIKKNYNLSRVIYAFNEKRDILKQKYEMHTI